MSGVPIVSQRFRRTATIAGSVVGGLILLDFIGFLATAYFSAELLQYAQKAGVSGLLKR